MAQYYSTFLHSHALLWLLAIIVFAVAVIFSKRENSKLGKIFQMVLRLLFVLVIGTGIILVIINNFHWAVVVKGVLAIWLITIMEFIVTKAKKQQQLSMSLWIQFIVLFVVVLYFGYFVT